MSAAGPGKPTTTPITSTSKVSCPAIQTDVVNGTSVYVARALRVIKWMSTIQGYHNAVWGGRSCRRVQQEAARDPERSGIDAYFVWITRYYYVLSRGFGDAEVTSDGIKE